MNTQKKFLKVLSMLTIILLIATIFIPGNGNRNAVASIGILGILMLFLSTLLPKIYKLTLNLLKNQGKTSPWSSLKSSEPVSETEELLWRQISYQITDKLQAAFPNATWEFQKPPSMKQLLCGNPIRLRTFHTEDYNFAEARMNQYGSLYPKRKFGILLLKIPLTATALYIFLYKSPYHFSLHKFLAFFQLYLQNIFHHHISLFLSLISPICFFSIFSICASFSLLPINNNVALFISSNF